MKFERRIGNRSVYSEVINGRLVRATTAAGERGAQAIFAILRQTKGVGTSAPVANPHLARGLPQRRVSEQ